MSAVSTSERPLLTESLRQPNMYVHACGQAQFTAPAQRTIQKQLSTLSGWEDRLATWNVRKTKKKLAIADHDAPVFSSSSTFSKSHLARSFNSGSFVGEALNQAAFLLRKGSECAIADTPLSTRYPPPPRIATYAHHELVYEIILTVTFFTPSQ